MHAMPSTLTQALVDYPGSGNFSFMAQKADMHAPACSSENHDNDLSLMLTQDAMSDDYARRTSSSEEFMFPT
jgi:hypothetical protein